MKPGDLVVSKDGVERALFTERTRQYIMGHGTLAEGMIAATHLGARAVGTVLAILDCADCAAPAMTTKTWVLVLCGTAYGWRDAKHLKVICAAR